MGGVMSVYCSRKVKVVSVVVVFGGDGREGRRLVEVNKIDDGVGQVSPSHALAVRFSSKNLRTRSLVDPAVQVCQAFLPAAWLSPKDKN